MSTDGIDDTPTNLARPKTDATLTIRVIKSFEYRTERSLILHHVNLEETTVGQLKELARQGNPCHCLTFYAASPTVKTLLQQFRHNQAGSRTAILSLVSQVLCCAVLRSSDPPRRHAQALHQGAWG